MMSYIFIRQVTSPAKMIDDILMDMDGYAGNMMDLVPKE